MATAIFQYPQSDRALCNLLRDNTEVEFYDAFSIPNRIEPSATVVTGGRSGGKTRLSVSPIGSSPLQLFSGVKAAVEALTFQYPQSDRALCNQAAQ